MEFSVGRALATTFRVWFRNFLPFTLLSAVIHLPVLLWLGWILADDLTPERVEQMQTYGRYAGVLGIVLNILLTSTMIYGVVMELRGRHASLGASVATGMARFFPALGVTVLVVLAVFAGLLALIFPGAIVYCMLYVAVPASVIERPGITGAIKRSATLTEGHRGQIFGLVLLAFVASFVAAKVIEDTLLEPARHGRDILSSLRTYAVVDAAREILFSTFGAVLAAVTYFQLRESKEGTTADELAKVFD